MEGCGLTPRGAAATGADVRPPLPAQAKSLGDQLVVGLIPDREILRCKGPPVLNEEERYALVASVKWVDEVITGGWAVEHPPRRGPCARSSSGPGWRGPGSSR